VNSKNLKSNIKRSFYPLFIDISDKSCIVFGGGKVAERKIRMLLNFNAHVKVISPEVTKALKKLANANKIELLLSEYAPGNLHDSVLVFAATNNDKINERIKKEAARMKIPVNVVDNPSLCDFFVPSIIKKGPIVIAISTSGTLPMLSKKLRQEIEKNITKDHIHYARTIGKLRKDLLNDIQSKKKRKAIMNKIKNIDIKDFNKKELKKIYNVFQVGKP